MEELITLTNSENFSSRGFTYLKKLIFETENSQLHVQIRLIDKAEKEVEWVISAENVFGFKNLDSGNLMPYLKIIFTKIIRCLK